MQSITFVKDTPWGGLGHQFNEPIRSINDMITQSGLDYSVISEKMYTAEHGEIPGYNAIYREDNDHLIGVVNKNLLNLTQNSEAFVPFEDLLGSKLEVASVGTMYSNKIAFACFKCNEPYKVVDDDVDHYFVVMNEHLKPDGNITILHTPVRIICQNVMSYAMNSRFLKTRMPIVGDAFTDSNIAAKIVDNSLSVKDQLDKSAAKLLKIKTSREYVDRLLDELFPVPEMTPSNQNAVLAAEMRRETFMDCMNADDLSNYSGTEYQVYNAIIDYATHYHTNAAKAYDLDHRMGMVPGIKVAESPANIVTKFLSIRRQLAA